MCFRPLTTRDVRWTPASGQGLEHLHITTTPDGIAARSVVIGERNGIAYGLSYAIRCDADWRVNSLQVEAAHGDRLALNSPAPGVWTDADGTSRPEFDGCIDVDLSGTPFTNTLPIRRLEPQVPGETLALRMLYVPFDTFDCFADEQRHTAVEPGRRYRYESADGSFSADLTVDEDGLVVDYPTLFKRS